MTWTISMHRDGSASLLNPRGDISRPFSARKVAGDAFAAMALAKAHIATRTRCSGTYGERIGENFGRIVVKDAANNVVWTLVQA